jgi:hypothetical protein
MTMLPEQDVWTVQEKNLPPWILEAIPQFNAAIQEQEA